mmetsp:Transcript_16709/g.33406  ORF Transcript_16709/g.33406 Transcript_16709/m.33406 type:complete len:232 (-) Transcript_16709:1453-2148(-)
MYRTEEPPTKMKFPTPMQLSVKRSHGCLRVRPNSLYSRNKTNVSRIDEAKSGNVWRKVKSGQTQDLRTRSDDNEPLLGVVQETGEDDKAIDEHKRMSQKMWLAKLAMEASTAIKSMSSKDCERSSKSDKLESGVRIREYNEETVFTENTYDTGYTDWDDWTSDTDNEFDEITEVLGGGCGFEDDFSDVDSRVVDDEVIEKNRSGCGLGEEVHETLMSFGGCVHFYVPGFSF